MDRSNKNLIVKYPFVSNPLSESKIWTALTIPAKKCESDALYIWYWLHILVYKLYKNFQQIQETNLDFNYVKPWLDLLQL